MSQKECAPPSLQQICQCSLISDEGSLNQSCKHELIKHQLAIHWRLLCQWQHLSLCQVALFSWGGKGVVCHTFLRHIFQHLSRFSFVLLQTVAVTL